MLTTLKDYKEEISLLPNPVKFAIAAALVFAIGFAVYFGAGNFISNRKIERLEKQNAELNVQAQSATEKAARAEINAASEAVRAQDLESKLKTLEAKSRKSDENISLQTKKSDSLRNDLNRVRLSRPANAGTDELERRLRERYGQTVGNQ